MTGSIGGLTQFPLHTPHPECGRRDKPPCPPCPSGQQWSREQAKCVDIIQRPPTGRGHDYDEHLRQYARPLFLEKQEYYWSKSRRHLQVTGAKANSYHSPPYTTAEIYEHTHIPFKNYIIEMIAEKQRKTKMIILSIILIGIGTIWYLMTR